MNVVVEGFLLFLPAGIANMTPVFANKVPVVNRWSTPMDFGAHIGKERIFGDHKTWRGFVTGVVLGGLGAIVLLPLAGVDGDMLRHFVIGLSMGAGALLGDAVKSFFKRRANVKPGGTWIPFDQIDYIIGGGLVLWLFGLLTVKLAIVITLLYFVLVLLSTYIGYKLRLKDSPI